MRKKYILSYNHIPGEAGSITGQHICFRRACLRLVATTPICWLVFSTTHYCFEIMPFHCKWSDLLRTLQIKASAGDWFSTDNTERSKWKLAVHIKQIYFNGIMQVVKRVHAEYFRVSLLSKSWICEYVITHHMLLGQGHGDDRRRGSHTSVHANQQLHAQSDACVPSQREDAHVTCHNGWPQEVLHRRGAVRVSIKDLRKRRKVRSDCKQRLTVCASVEATIALNVEAELYISVNSIDD